MSKMREFKALIAIADLLGGESSATALTGFDAICAELLREEERTGSRPDQHIRLYRKWARRLLPDNWVTAAEAVLRAHSLVWIDYIASLNEGDLPVNERLKMLLLLNDRPDFEPCPAFWQAAKSLREACALEQVTPSSAKPRKGRAVSSPPAPAMIDRRALAEATEVFTRSQAEARDRVLALAQLYFDSPTLGRLRPRTSPLLVAPTGSGKTALLRSVAKALDAHLLRLTVAEWVPIGASRDLTPALVEVAEALGEHARVIVFIDELDKFVDDGRSWSRSAGTEVFNILERTLPASVFSILKKEGETRQLIEERLQSGMFVVGAGTWQSLHQAKPKSPLGFSTTCVTETSDPILLRAIKEAGFPAELLGRFHSRPVALPYPTRQETEELFRRFGIADRAARVGFEPRLREFSWEPFGFRSLESLLADLLLAERDRERASVHSVH